MKDYNTILIRTFNSKVKANIIHTCNAFAEVFYQETFKVSRYTIKTSGDTYYIDNIIESIINEEYKGIKLILKT